MTDQYAYFSTGPAVTLPLAATPLVLFDTRNWLGGSNDLVNEGSLGTGLKVKPTFTPRAAGFHTGDGVVTNPFDWKMTFPYPTTTWAAVGGDERAGGWTLMAVINLRQPEVGWDYQIQGMFNLVRHEATWTLSAGRSTSSLIKMAFPGASTLYDGTITPGGGSRFDVAKKRADGTTIDTEFQPGFIVAHFDTNWKLSYLWINGVQQQGQWDSGFGPSAPSAPTSMSMTAALTGAGLPSVSALTQFGTVQRTKPPPHAADEYVYSIAALALFRGIPDRPDLDAWQAYFMPPGQKFAPQPLSRYVKGDGVNAVSESFSVPTRPAPHTVTSLRFRARGAGRYQQWYGYFDMSVNSGDIIRVEAGGLGQPGNLGGFGGWPDGGRGGLNIYVDAIPSKRGNGGSGATRIYKNGTLMAVLAGSGGYGSFWDDTPEFKDNGNVPGIYARYYQPGTVAGGPAGTNAVYDGKGGTASAGGLKGTGGLSGTGSDGSAGQGGDGANINQAGSSMQRPSGGGGGGGGAYGGGGGAYYSSGANASRGRGGGGGSNWFHASLTFPVNLPYAGTAGTDAQVWVFEKN